MWNAEYAFDQFKKFKEVIAAVEGSNEATTRLRAIDTMLFDVLGWDRTNVDAETYCRAVGFTDYAFRDFAGLSLVLEAKREEKTFVLPGNHFSSTPVGFALLAKECPEADVALRQALGYAAGLGARYIAISNGFQWLLTLTFVPRQQVDDRSVLVFESLEAIEDRFRLFFDCFSPIGVDENRSQDALLEQRQAPPPARLSQRIPNYPATASRNQIANELSVVLGAVWEEARHDENDLLFLHECYVEPEANAGALALANELIGQRLSTDERAFVKSIEMSHAPSLLISASVEKPIVVLGNVGNGKSTFLRYLRLVRAKDVLKKYIQIDVNFVDRPDSAAEVPSFIYGQIEDQLRDSYEIDVGDDSLVRAALNADINRFKKTPEAKAFVDSPDAYKREELAFIKRLRDDRHTYFQKVFAHIRGSRQFSVAIFLDNLDRRNPDIQEEAYLKASAMARDWSALVFVCLRPATFYRSKAFGVLDSVAPKVITVAPPSPEPVLVKRLKYASKYAKGEPLPEREDRAPLSLTFAMELPSVAIFLDCLAVSFRKRHELIDLFEAISNGNTRELLRYVYAFLTSLHLNTSEILAKTEADDRYIVPVHHALRAVLFGDFMHYDPRQSAFLNLFDVQHADPAEHFSRLSALLYLQSIPDVHPTYRFIPVGELYRHLQQSGYTAQHAQWTVRCLYNGKCLESRDPVESWDDGVREVRITPLGKYHVTSLCGTFQYLDAVTVDTPIMDDKARESIREVWNIHERLARCTIFLSYLDASVQHLGDSVVHKAWKSVKEAVAAEISSIEASIR